MSTIVRLLSSRSWCFTTLDRSVVLLNDENFDEKLAIKSCLCGCVCGCLLVLTLFCVCAAALGPQDCAHVYYSMLSVLACVCGLVVDFRPGVYEHESGVWAPRRLPAYNLHASLLVLLSV